MNLRMSRYACAGCLVAAFAASATAEGLQFQCGASDGFSHFSDQGLAAGQGGWERDTISGGETVVRFNIDTGSVVVRFKDAYEDWTDVEDLGGTVEFWHLQEEPLSIGFLVIYDVASASSVEVNTVSEVDFAAQTARLTTSQSRISETITSTRVLTSECRVTAF